MVLVMRVRREVFHVFLTTAICFFTGCASVTPPGAAPGLPTSATAGGTTIVAIAPPGKGSHSVWDLLGVEQAVTSVAAGKHRIRDHIASKLGMRFPGLEPIPELKLITDPANLAEDAPPTVKAAAEIKMKEDQAQQKIKGIRYLATIGCGGCYPDVEDALLKSLEDCTEEVRYETVVAIRDSTGRECSFCSAKACCSQKVHEKLLEITTLGECDCYSEPSARVRRQARLALRQCGPEIRVPVDELEGDVPINGNSSGNGGLPKEKLEEDVDDEEPSADGDLDDDEAPSPSPTEPDEGDLALGVAFQPSPVNQIFRPW